MYNSTQSRHNALNKLKWITATDDNSVEQRKIEGSYCQQLSSSSVSRWKFEYAVLRENVTVLTSVFLLFA